MAKIESTKLDSLIKGVPEGSIPRRLNVDDRLFVEVRRPGAAAPKCSFVLRYSYGGKKQSMGLGRYFPEGTAGLNGITLANARKAAAAHLKDIDKGEHPVKARKEKVAKDTADREAKADLEKHTVRAAAEQWHADSRNHEKVTSDKYRSQRWRRLGEYLDILGNIPVSTLTVRDVSAAVEVLKTEDKKTGRKADRIETLRRSIADLEKALDHVSERGWFDGINPATRVRKGMGGRPKAEGRRAFSPDRLAEFSKALQGVDIDAPYPVTAHLLRMLALTAARTREIRLMTWADVVGLDTDTATMSIPASRMKRRKAWSIPLSTQVVELLRDIKRWQAEAGEGLKAVADGYVFVRLDGNYKGRLASENAVNDKLKAMGWHKEVTGHGLRKVMRTVGGKLWPYNGANRKEALEWALAHADANKMVEVYDLNDHIDLRRELLQWWADHLDLLRQPQGSNVVPMRAA